MSLSVARDRATLTAFWLACFAASLTVPGFFRLADRIRTDTAFAALETISALYAPYVGAVTAYHLSKRKPSKAKPSDERSTALVVSIVASVLWNLVVWGIVGTIIYSDESFSAALTYASRAASQMSWLLAPVMGYYFAVDGGASRAR